MSILNDADWVTHSLRVGYLRYVDDHYARQVIESSYDGNDARLDLKSSEQEQPSPGGKGPESVYISPHRQAEPVLQGAAVHVEDAPVSSEEAPAAIAKAPSSAAVSWTTAVSELPSAQPEQTSAAGTAASEASFTKADLLEPRARPRPRERTAALQASLTPTQSTVDAVASGNAVDIAPKDPTAPTTQSKDEGELHIIADSSFPTAPPQAETLDPQAFSKLSRAEIAARSKAQRPQISAIAATLQAESEAASNPFAALYKDVCARNLVPAAVLEAAVAAAAPAAPPVAPNVPMGRVRHRHGARTAGRSLGPMNGRGTEPSAGQGPSRTGGPGRVEVFFPFAYKVANTNLAASAPSSTSATTQNSTHGPIALKPKTGSMTLFVRGDAKMEEIIGYALYCYVDAKWSPPLRELKDWATGDQDEIKLTTLGYCLRIVEDGEVDDDFPALDRSLVVGKFGGDEFAVCQASPAQIKENEVSSEPFRASRKAALAASLKAAAEAAAKANDVAATTKFLSPNSALTPAGGTSVAPQTLGNTTTAGTGKLGMSAVTGTLPQGPQSGSSSTADGAHTVTVLSGSVAPGTMAVSAAGATAAASALAAGTSLSTSMGISRSLVASGLGGVSQQLEASVFLRVLHMAKQNVHVKIMIQVPAQMYFADVLELICRKVKEDKPEAWALVAHFGGEDVVVPLNRTVESLDEACDLKLVRRETLVERGVVGRLTAPGGNPNTSIFAGRNKTNKEDYLNALDMSAYKSWKVTRAARSARMFSKPERLLTLDGEWIWIEPADARQFSARPTSFHISTVIACKQSTKGGASFKLVIRRQPSVMDAPNAGGPTNPAASASAAAAAAGGRDTKRYDLEAESADAAEAIVREIHKVMARRRESRIEVAA